MCLLLHFILINLCKYFIHLLEHLLPGFKLFKLCILLRCFLFMVFLNKFYKQTEYVYSNNFSCEIGTSFYFRFALKRCSAFLQLECEYLWSEALVFRICWRRVTELYRCHKFARQTAFFFVTRQRAILSQPVYIMLYNPTFFKNVSF